MVRAVVDAGADAVELGIPFSDPVMDGVTIQEASKQALAQGATPRGIIAEAASLEVDVPLVVMTYTNPVGHMGYRRFAAALHDSGIAAAILPDLPLDELDGWADAADAHEVETVLLAAPNTPDERLRAICERSRGFVYGVSLMGVTGERASLAEQAAGMGKRLKATTDKPALLGVGISNAEQAVEASQYADGVIVGSALMARVLADGARCRRRRPRVRRRAAEPRCDTRQVGRAGRSRVIKYLGSKRRLVPVLTRLCEAAGAATALDLFTGTTRVAQAFKRTGAHVTAVDSARYSEVFAQCYVATDADHRRPGRARRRAARRSNALPRYARLLHRDLLRAVTLLPAVQRRARSTPSATPSRATTRAARSNRCCSPASSEAADRVDSTTGLQMAYVKQWAPRSAQSARAACARAARRARAPRSAATRSRVASTLAPVDLAYLDPPYNQHRYFTNYHVWETLVAWDAPEHYGVACKRVDARDPATHSPFNKKREMPARARAGHRRRAGAGGGAVVQRRVVGRASTICSTCARCTATWRC